MKSEAAAAVILCFRSDSGRMGQLARYYTAMGFGRIGLLAAGPWGPMALNKLKNIKGTHYLGHMRDDQMVINPLVEAKFPASWIAVVSSRECLVLPFGSVAKTVQSLTAMGLDQLRACSVPPTPGPQRLVLQRNLPEGLTLARAHEIVESGKVSLQRGPIQAALLPVSFVPDSVRGKPYERARTLGHVIEPDSMELKKFRLSMGLLNTAGPKASSGGRRPTASPGKSIAKSSPARAEKPGRFALVSFELMGATKCGGIGTAMSALAELLARAGHEVEVIFCPFWGTDAAEPGFVKRWQEVGVGISYFPRCREGERYPDHDDYAFRLTEFLKSRGTFDVIHFHDSAGYAALPLLLRASGLAFQDSRIIVTVHGPSRWHRIGNALSWNRDEALQNHFEEISLRLADVVVTPSFYMSEWISRNFQHARRGTLLPNALPIGSRLFARRPRKALPKFQRLVFFGRAERRKGIEIFLEAIQEAIDLGLKGVEILILGSLGEGMTEEWFSERAKSWPLPIRVDSDKGHMEALEILRDGSSLVIIPSLLDNSPYTIYECLEAGVPILASSTGGIPELIAAKDHARVLFRPEDVTGLAKLIVSAVKKGLQPASLSFPVEAADIDLLALHCGELGKARRSRSQAAKAMAAGTGQGIALVQHAAAWVSGDNDDIHDLSSLRPAETYRLRFSSNEAAGDVGAARVAFRNIGRGHKASRNLQKIALQSRCEILFVCPADHPVSREELTAGLRLMQTLDADAVCFSCMVKRNEDDALGVLIATAGPAELSPFQNSFGCGPFLIRRQEFASLAGTLGSLWNQSELHWLILNALLAQGGSIFGLPYPFSTVPDYQVPPGVIVPAPHLSGQLMSSWSKGQRGAEAGFLRMSASNFGSESFGDFTPRFRRSGDESMEALPGDNIVAVPDTAPGPRHLSLEEAINSLEAELLQIPLRTGDRAPALSVLVCTHNRPDGLARLLDSLKSQIENENGRELIVYNDGTDSPAYQKIIEAEGTWFDYKVGAEPGGVAAARNAVASHASGDYLVFIDDDCVAPRWWLDWLGSKLAAGPRIDAIAGTTLPNTHAATDLNATVQSIFEMVPKPQMYKEETVVFVTANLAISRDLFWKSGGFAANREFNGAGEDTELALRLAASGARVELDFAWHVYHDVGERLRDRVRRYYRYGLANRWMYEHSHARPYVESVFKSTSANPLFLRFYRDLKTALATVREHDHRGIPAFVLACNKALSSLSFLAGCRAAKRHLKAKPAE